MLLARSYRAGADPAGELMRRLRRSDRDVGLELVVSLGHNSRMQRPPTRFAWHGDVSLAYQVCGEGPTDLVYLQGYCSNVDANWDGPHLARFLRGLAKHARLIITDRRGWGCAT